MNLNKESKGTYGGRVIETKAEERDGIPVGIVKGHLATFDIDFGMDRFRPGAFKDSLAAYKVGNRPIRLRDEHSELIGGFPISKAFEDDKGLYVEGEINLNVQRGAEIYALARQGILSDLSIGFVSRRQTMNGPVRDILQADINEGSIVADPMNSKANITEVKSVVPFQDLPIAPRDTEWEGAEAISRIKEGTDSMESPSSDYRRGFLWYDADDADNFGAYKLPIADWIDGQLQVVPAAIFASASAVAGARGGLDIPPEDRATLISHINQYYDKMGLDSPLDITDERSRHPDDSEDMIGKSRFSSKFVKDWEVKDLHQFLIEQGSMSVKASNALITRFGLEIEPPSISSQSEADINMYKKLMHEIGMFPKAAFTSLLK